MFSLGVTMRPCIFDPGESLRSSQCTRHKAYAKSPRVSAWSASSSLPPLVDFASAALHALTIAA